MLKNGTVDDPGLILMTWLQRKRKGKVWKHLENIVAIDKKDPHSKTS